MNKYIKTYEEFKYESIDEGLLGGLWKKIKTGLSLAISKKIGGAGKIDKAMVEYTKIISNIIDKKIKADGESLAKKVAQEKSNTPELKAAYEQSKKASDMQIQLLNKQQVAEKNKFDAKMKNVIGDNVLLIDYFNLKKAELASEMIAKELQAYEKLGGGDVEDPNWQKEFKGRQAKLAEFQKQASAMGAALEKKTAEGKKVASDIVVGGKFMYASESEGKDIMVEVLDLQEEKNKKIPEDNNKLIKVKTPSGEFEVKKSLLKKIEETDEVSPEPQKEEKSYGAGDEVTYTKKDGNENSGKIADDQNGVADGYIKITTDKNANGFVISKTQIKS